MVVFFKGVHMKLLLILTLISCQFSLAQNDAHLPTVDYVDLQKYQGTWYEIARFDQKFQKGCTSVTAEYILTKNSKVKVLNKCRLNSPSGKLKIAKGKAWVVDKESNSKLKVQFFLSFIKLGFLAGDYWIIDLDDNYEHVMVGAPDRNYLWILARRPFLDEDILDGLKLKAKRLGFDTKKLLMTVH
jgi:apolipoprotein D and lipocalin family protein